MPLPNGCVKVSVAVPAPVGAWFTVTVWPRIASITVPDAKVPVPPVWVTVIPTTKTEGSTTSNSSKLPGLVNSSVAAPAPVG